MKIGLMAYGSLDRVTGGNVYDRLLASRLRARGDQVEVISLKTRALAGRAFDNLTERLPLDFDVLLQDELIHLSMLLPNRRTRRFPVVSILHNLHSSERRAAWKNAAYRPVEKLYLESVDGLVYNSRTTMDSVRRGLGVRKPDAVAQPGGDRLGSWTMDEVRARSVESSPLRLIFLANVTRLKGLHVLLDALSLLPARRFELHVVGACDIEPGYSAAMHKRAAEIEARVAFHGRLDGDSLISLLRHAQVLVIPSYYEGFGISYLEGMAFGLPAIGTTSGAVRELITPGHNGYLIAPGDSRDLASCLDALGRDRGLLAQMSVNALRFFSTQPTWDDCADSVRGFLLNLIESRGSERM